MEGALLHWIKVCHNNRKGFLITFLFNFPYVMVVSQIISFNVVNHVELIVCPRIG